MSILSRFRRRKDPYKAATEEEQISRYVYLLNTLPASVIESAHATAFSDIPVARRREMFEQLRPFMSDAERTASPDDPHVLAKLVRRAEERRAEREAARGGPDAEAEASVKTLTATDARDRDRPPRSADAQRRHGTRGVPVHRDQLRLGLLHRRRRLARHRRSAGLGRRHGEPRIHRDRCRHGGGGYDGGGGGGYDGGGFSGGFDAGGFGGGFDGGGGFG